MDRLEIQQHSRFRRQLQRDENRLNYFVKHNGLCAAGWGLLAREFQHRGAAVGPWVQYVVQYTGAEVGWTVEAVDDAV
jgi:hypothetical protein